MLKDTLFNIISTDHQQNQITAVLQINESHEIFAGHFPGQPVVPGACMLQLIKEVLTRVLSKPLRLSKADNIKFLTLVEPTGNPTASLTISYTEVADHIKAGATLIIGENASMKFQGTFVAV